MAVSFCQIAASRGLQRSFISWSDLRLHHSYHNSSLMDVDGGRVIFVSKDESGQSTTVQGAVDLVPAGNTARVKIYISSGIYREKVFVASSKPYISFIGNESGGDTVISWNLKSSDRDSGGRIVGTSNSATVEIEADYFCAVGITFENTAEGAKPGDSGMQAVALRIAGDKVLINRCRILGHQDTLFDQTGRHYFYECYIQGSIDFIFGSARSLYQACTLHAVAENFGAIAASQRNSSLDNSGFSFNTCKVYGTGMVYLGRAWGQCARIVYSDCELEGIIIPEGWDDWGDSTRQNAVWFGEFNCSGSGADLSKRVSWARSLTYEETKPFLDKSYVDGDEWLSL
ncbi:Pectinesterase QRT1 [Platanthera zijinensis]|uniref:Pectinesterase n=1 Tax=Platanthera zijinensis TaxID=2320716 RepID=A0AAP0BUE7_9ASPA